MKTRIVRIGNSQGVRIPKPLLEEAGLDGDVRLRVVESGIMIESRSRPRGRWSDAAELLHARQEDGLIDQPVPTLFDTEEWAWE